MFIESLKLMQHTSMTSPWILKEFKIGNINLIVGENSSGKTRFLNMIKSLSNLTTGLKLFADSAEFNVKFKKDNIEIVYELKYEISKVLKEELTYDKKPLLKRGAGGIGKIEVVELKKLIDFQTPESEIACFAKRDFIQHPFLDDIYKWGKSTLHYFFSSSLGKEILIFPQTDIIDKINLKNTSLVNSILNNGINKYGEPFSKLILKDMNKIGYNLEEIKLDTMPKDVVDIEAVGIVVKEKELEHLTNQIDMSQGMFRALSLIIQLNYCQFLDTPPYCILIDDIGEGLDFERSSALISLLIEKYIDTPTQLIMSTNDRFVMNKVPLEYWNVIQRQGSECKVYNYYNSKKIFDDFKFTGLNNFDFFTSEYYLNGKID